MKPAWEVLHPYVEVTKGRVTEDSFVVAMGGIWERLELNRNVEIDSRYLDPEGFYRRTHFTDAMKKLLKNIIKRLNREPTQSIYHLQVGMGGGKSHTLLLLYYLAKNPDQALPFLRRKDIASKIPGCQVSVIDGMRISPAFGFEFPDKTRIRTLWGFLFKQLGVYEKFKETADWEEAPSVPILKEAFNEKPTLILIDELTHYMANVMSNQRLTDKTQAFLQSLTAAVKETPGCALIVTTPIGVYRDAHRLVSQILTRYCQPTILASGREYKRIRRRALYTDDFIQLESEIETLAEEYQSYYKIHLPNRALAIEEGIRDNYPFHPFVDATLQKLKENTAFQEVRDELRFLAGLIYSVHKTRDPDAQLITVGHAQLKDQYVRGGTVAKLQDPTLVARLDTDLERIKELPQEAQKTGEPILTTILLNSLTSGIPIERGVTEEEITYALLNPSTNPTLIHQALTQIGKMLWFVDLVNNRWVFGQPNLNKLINDYLRKVEKDKSIRGLWWNNIIKELRDWKDSTYNKYAKQARKKGAKPLFQQNNILTWINRSDEIPDDRATKLVFADYTLPLSAIIPDEFLTPEERTTTITTRVANTPKKVKEVVRDLHENYGQTARNFKNTVFSLVADQNLVQRNGPVGHAKQLLALEEMLKDREQLRPLIGESGLREIEEMRVKGISDLRHSCVTTYRYLVYPSKDVLSCIELSEDRRDTDNFLNLIDERLRSQARKIIDTIDTDSLLERYWPKGRKRVEVKNVINGFYKRPELELVTDRDVIDNSIRNAIVEGKIAYMISQDIYYRKEPLRLEDDGILLKDPELVAITIEAVDDVEEPQRIQIKLNGKRDKWTPLKIEDLMNATHVIEPSIPQGMRFLGWSDGYQEALRTLTWDRKQTLHIHVKSEAPKPTEEVNLTIRAFDVKTNNSVEVTIEVDDLIYKTPFHAKMTKNHTCKIKIERPAGMIFKRWNDNEPNAERTLLCDIDQILIAKFEPLVPGEDILEGTISISDASTIIEENMHKEANSIRLEFLLDYPNFSKNAGAILQVLTRPYKAEITGSGGKSIGLDEFSVRISGDSDKQSLLRSCLTQLKDYLENLTVTFVQSQAEYEKLQALINKDALAALKKAKGILNYRIQIQATTIPDTTPKRTLDTLIKDFKKAP